MAKGHDTVYSHTMHCFLSAQNAAFPDRQRADQYLKEVKHGKINFDIFCVFLASFGGYAKSSEEVDPIYPKHIKELR